MRAKSRSVESTIVFPFLHSSTTRGKTGDTNVPKNTEGNLGLAPAKVAECPCSVSEKAQASRVLDVEQHVLDAMRHTEELITQLLSVTCHVAAS